jgi:DtxR family Mn-dependent transcriptional regulator
VAAPSLPAEAVKGARAAGFVLPAQGGPVLTEAGLKAARSVVRRHRLAECLLRDVLGLGEDEVDADACEFEHIIQHGLDEKICVLLGHPRQCPHGRPIPPGECCRKAPADAFHDVGPLTEGPLDTDGLVAWLQTTSRREVQKLMALGVLPGVPIRLLRRSPSYVFQLGYSQFTVDRELAQKIHVRWSGGAPRS